MLGAPWEDGNPMVAGMDGHRLELCRGVQVELGWGEGLG